MLPDGKSRYAFQCETSLMEEGKRLAKAYRLSFNMLLVYLLANATEEWAVAGMQKREKPEEAREREKDLT